MMSKAGSLRRDNGWQRMILNNVVMLVASTPAFVNLQYRISSEKPKAMVTSPNNVEQTFPVIVKYGKISSLTYCQIEKVGIESLRARK